MVEGDRDSACEALRGMRLVCRCDQSFMSGKKAAELVEGRGGRCCEGMMYLVAPLI